MEKQLFEKNRIIGILATQLIVNSQDISKKKKKKKKSVTILLREIALIKIKIMTPCMKKKESKVYQTTK